MQGADDVGGAAAGGDADECVLLGEACGGEVGCALLGDVFSGFAGFAEGFVAAGHEALDECGRDGEGGWALGGVEDAEAAAGSGSDVEEAAALLEACGDCIDGFGDVGEFGGYGGGDLCVFFVDDAEHVECGKLIDVLGCGVAGLRWGVWRGSWSSMFPFGK